jgi:hypothetical protein
MAEKAVAIAVAKQTGTHQITTQRIRLNEAF